MRRDSHRRITCSGRYAFPSFLGGLIILFVVILDSPGQRIQTKHRSGKAADETINAIVERVKQYPDTAVNFENFEGVPLAIQQAAAKAITSTEYYQLTRTITDSAAYTAFPSVTLTNTTDQRVTGFALLLGDRRTRRVHWVNFTKVGIEPNGNYSVSPQDWVLPEKIVRITDKGQVMRSKHSVDFNSEKMWLPSPITDLILKVGIVQFEGGKKWIIDDSKGSW